MKNNKLLNFFFNIFKGGLIGIAAVIPGFSGGTIACIIGVYDDIIESISGFRKHPKQSIKTLLPYILGILIFALLLIIPITWGINNHPLITVSLFAGLLLGGLPSFYKNIQNNTEIKNFAWGIIGLVLILAIIIPSLFVGEKYISLISAPWYMYLLVMLMGVIASSALVVPGISGSMVLLIIGLYNPIMDTIKGFISSIFTAINHPIDMSFSSPNMNEVIGADFILPSLGLIICFGIGIIIGFIIVSKIMKFLLTKYKTPTYFAIFGFIIGSFVGIYAKPSYYLNLNWVSYVLAVIAILIGFFLAFYLGNIASKKNISNNIDKEEDNNHVTR